MVLSELLEIQDWDQIPLLSLRMLKLKRRIIKLLMDDDRTIIELCKITEFSIPTVTKMIGELTEAGVVFEKGKLDTAGGRRPVIYGINPNCAYFLGVDVKRDSISFGLQNLKNELAAEVIRKPFNLLDSRASFDDLCACINDFVSASGIEKNRILSACVVFTGRINSEKGYNSTFFCFEEAPVNQLIEQQIGIKTFIENDSRAMLYGEYCTLAERKHNVIYLNMSWGFGISMICNGELYYGQSGYSGEFGHSPILDNEVICSCGKKGCIQTEVSGETILNLFKERLREGSISSLTRRKNIDEITMYDVIHAAVDDGDMLAIEVIGKVGNRLGRYLSLLVNVFNPDMVIIGGDVSAAGSYLELPVKSALQIYSLNILLQDLTLKTASLGNKAGVIGACQILTDKLFDK